MASGFRARAELAQNTRCLTFEAVVQRVAVDAVPGSGHSRDSKGYSKPFLILHARTSNNLGYELFRL